LFQDKVITTFNPELFSYAEFALFIKSTLTVSATFWVVPFTVIGHYNKTIEKKLNLSFVINIYEQL